MERRNSKRIALEVPVLSGPEKGLLRDISENGAYFITAGSYQVGDRVSFSFELRHAIPEKPLRFRCSGHVTRMENLGEKLGVATTIEKFTCLH